MAVRPLQFPIIAVDKTAKAFNQIRNKLGGLRKAALGVGAVVAGVGAAFAVALKKTVDFADEIAKTADKVGFSTSALQELRIATDLAGISQEQLDTALGAMSKRIGELRAGTGALNTFLDKTDKSFKAQLLSTTSNEKAFRLLIQRIQGMSNAQDRAALSAAAFSRSAGIAISKLSLSELDEGIKRARDLGLIIDENLLRNAEKLKDDFELAAQVIKTTFIQAVLKALQDVDLSRLADQLSQMAKTALLLLERVGKFFGILETPIEDQIRNLNKELETLNLQLELAASRPVGSKQAVEFINSTISGIKKQIQALEELKRKTQEAPVIAQKAAPLPKQIIESKTQILGIVPAVEKANTALEKFVETGKDVFSSIQDIGVSSIQKLEDSIIGLIQGTVSAKDAFKSMVKSIIDDLLRMVIRMQITIPIARALNSLLGGFFSGGPTEPFPAGGFDAGAMRPRAMGGPVSAGRPYLVGERGPEIMVPNRSGTVIPNHSMGGGVVVNQTLHIETGVAQTVRAEIAQLMPQIADNTKAAVLDARRRGGTFANGFA